MQNQIIGQNPTSISSPATSSQANLPTGYIGIIPQLLSALKTDVQRVQMLMQNGTINQKQGQCLIAQLAEKFNEINACTNSVPQADTNVQPQQQPKQMPIQTEQSQSPLDLFNQEKPDFFNQAGRTDVLNYIKDLDMNKDEIAKVAQLVETIEQSAVNDYLQKSAHEKSLNDENNTAKSKLTSYAQNATSGNIFDRIFTRDDIGRMSGDEFTQNEKDIMAQSRQGLIK